MIRFLITGVFNDQHENPSEFYNQLLWVVASWPCTMLLRPLLALKHPHFFHPPHPLQHSAWVSRIVVTLASPWKLLNRSPIIAIQSLSKSGPCALLDSEPRFLPISLESLPPFSSKFNPSFRVQLQFHRVYKTFLPGCLRYLLSLYCPYSFYQKMHPEWTLILHRHDSVVTCCSSFTNDNVVEMAAASN